MSAAFQCLVCFEERTERLALPKLCTLNGDVLRAADCNHPICRECMAKFVAVRVEEQRAFGIRCPFEMCKNELHEQDIETLVKSGALAPQVGERLAELRKQDYTSRLSSLTDLTQLHSADDYKLMRRLWSSTRRCPRCNVIMERSEGCNSFGCICGHRFDFLKAPRGCGDGIEDFDSVLQLATEFDMPLNDATERVRQAHMKGIKNYQRVLSFATSKQIPLNLAEVHAQAILRQYSALEELRDARYKRRLARKANVLMTQLDISLERAVQLLQQAEIGDDTGGHQQAEIRARIREARQLQSRVHPNSTEPQMNSSAREVNLTHGPASLSPGDSTVPPVASAIITEQPDT